MWHNLTGKEKSSPDLLVAKALLQGHIEQIKQRRDAAIQKMLLQREHKKNKQCFGLQKLASFTVL
jgi:hypothetical protein